MSDEKSREPSANELDYPMKSESAKHPNSPAVTGADPQAQAAQRPGGGGSPGTGEQEDVSPSAEAKHQWAGAKHPSQAG